MNCGVYLITNTATDQVYVGSSKDINSRFSKHRLSLRSGKSGLPKLQEAWDKFGESSFTFKLIIACSAEWLGFYERKCVEIYNTIKNGYNKMLPSLRLNPHKSASFESRMKTILKLEGECLVPAGVRKNLNTMSVKYGGETVQLKRLVYEKANGKLPEEVIVYSNCGNEKCYKAEHLAITAKANTSALNIQRGFYKPPPRGESHHQGKMTEAGVCDIKSSSLSPKELALKYGVSTNLIGMIMKGKRWGWVQ